MANLNGDYALNGRWFMLARAEGQGRAWRRSGVQDAPSRRNINDTLYGNVADTLDHPEVWNDWSGGFGDAYEAPDRPNTYHWARGFDLRFPRQAIHAQAPQLLPARYASANTRIDFIMDVNLFNPGRGDVFVFGQDVVSMFSPTQFQNTAGSAFDIANFQPPGAIMHGHRAVVVGSYLYIPNLHGSAYLQLGTDNAFSLSLEPARWFQLASGRVYRATYGNKLRSAPVGADLMATASWAATIPIGNDQFVTEDAMAIEDRLYAGMPDGVYEGNVTGTFNNIASDLGTLVDTDNCRDLTAFQGGLAFAQGPHIWWYKPSQGGNTELREVGPSGLFANRSQIRGKFTSLRGNGKWLYAGLFTGSGSYFMVGRDASYPLPYVWHPLHDFLGLNVKVSRIHVDGISKAVGGTINIPNRIWAATEFSYGAQVGATSPLFVWPIPYGDNNPLSDTTFSPNFMGSARLDMPESEWMAPGTPKLWRSVETWGERIASGAQFGDLYYHVDQGTRATLGRVAVGPKDTRFFAAGEGSFVGGQALSISVDSYTASVNTTPVYRAFVVRGTLMPKSVDIVEARTRIADKMRNRRGAEMRTAKEMITYLRELAEATAPARLTDLNGVQSWVKVQAPVEETEFYQVGSEEPEVMALVRMSVLDFA